MTNTNVVAEEIAKYWGIQDIQGIKGIKGIQGIHRCCWWRAWTVLETNALQRRIPQMHFHAQCYSSSCTQLDIKLDTSLAPRWPSLFHLSLTSMPLDGLVFFGTPKNNNWSHGSEVQTSPKGWPSSWDNIIQFREGLPEVTEMWQD